MLCQGKWLCRDEGEKEAWVILQLEDTSVITDIDLGNSGAAFIELQVSLTLQWRDGKRSLGMSVYYVCLKYKCVLNVPGT